MSQYARCDRCHHSGGDHAEGCGEPDEAPLSPIALDFEAAEKEAWAEVKARSIDFAFSHYTEKEQAVEDARRAHLNTQLRALVARVAQEEREKALKEVRAKLTELYQLSSRMPPAIQQWLDSQLRGTP